MNSTDARPPLHGHRFMFIAWSLIAAKCALIAWVAVRWDLPFSAGWVIWPTLAFAALATLIWWTHRQE